MDSMARIDILWMSGDVMEYLATFWDGIGPADGPNSQPPDDRDLPF